MVREFSLVENCLNLLSEGKVRTYDSHTPIRESMVSKHNAETIKKFLNELMINDKEMTVYNYFYTIHAYGEFLKNKKFEKTGRDDFINYWSCLRTRNDIRCKKKDKNIADSTIKTVLARMKKFYMWLNNGVYPDWIKEIKIKSCKVELDPDSVLTEEEVRKMIEDANNQRDKAIVSLLYETGARIGEFLKIKVSDLLFDDYGVLVKITTGKLRKSESQEFRKVRVVNSVPYIKEWLKYHPCLRDRFSKKDNERNSKFYNNICENNDTWLWVAKRRKEGLIFNRMERGAVSYLLSDLAKKVEIEKPVNPHAFRHARATYLASKVTEPIQRKVMGWKDGSVMTKTYVHLNDIQVDETVLKDIYNTQTKKLEKAVDNLAPKTCKNCCEKNPADYDFCMKCNFPLNDVDIKGMEKKALTIAMTPQVMKLRRLREKIKCQNSLRLGKAQA